LLLLKEVRASGCRPTPTPRRVDRAADDISAGEPPIVVVFVTIEESPYK
jgi:hypothetical protein